MERFKLLKDCQDGEWVYFEVGRLCQVQEHFNSCHYKDLVNGYMRYGVNGNTKVYPLTIHNKVVSESVLSYYDEMHKKDLIHGSKWINWLSEKFDELMALDENSPSEKFQNIYREIEKQIKELEYHKSFL